MEGSHKQTYYEILGIPEYASAQKIKSAYRKRAQQIHPDKNKKPTAHRDFLALQEAYEILVDSEKRSSYDELLAGIRQASGQISTSDVYSFSRQSKVELVIVALFKKLAMVIIGGLLGIQLGYFSGFIILIFYNNITYSHERASYGFISCCLGCIIGLFPISILKKVKFIQTVQIGWATALILISISLYFAIVYSLAKFLLLNAP